MPGAAESLAGGRAFSFPFVVFGENASMAATYPEPGKAKPVPIDLGGGYMVLRFLGAGASWSRTTYEHTVGLAATIPHPLFFGRPASASGVEDGALPAREQALHVFASFVPIRRQRMEARVFGGPSFFSYSAEMVESVLYAQNAGDSPQNTIAIVGSSNRSVNGSGHGFHIGGDFTYFLHRLVGVGIGGRYSKGTVALDQEPLSQLGQEFRVGSKVVYLSVRVRLGG
jgi:hypothetical protein